jgi:uncharacterized surface protein with fasciclin (FAS1) repeats
VHVLLVSNHGNYSMLQVESGDIGNGDVVTTLASGLSVGFDTTDGVKIVHGATPKATVTTADIQASNGVIHIIDTVLQFPTQNLAELATGAGLSQLVGAVGTAGLSSTLSGDGPFTVFAPSNEAFEAIPEELPASLADIILYHVVDGVRTREGLSRVFCNGFMCCLVVWPLLMNLPLSCFRSSSLTPSRMV